MLINNHSLRKASIGSFLAAADEGINLAINVKNILVPTNPIIADIGK